MRGVETRRNSTVEGKHSFANIVDTVVTRAGEGRFIACHIPLDELRRVGSIFEPKPGGKAAAAR